MIRIGQLGGDDDNENDDTSVSSWPWLGSDALDFDDDDDDDGNDDDDDDDDDGDDDDDNLCFELALVGFRWTPLHSVWVNHPLEVCPAFDDDVEGDDDDGDDYDQHDDGGTRRPSR